MFSVPACHLRLRALFSDAARRNNTWPARFTGLIHGVVTKGAELSGDIQTIRHYAEVSARC